MPRPSDYRPGPRVPIEHAIPFVCRERLDTNDRQLLRRALERGNVDLWIVDRLLTRSGRPEMFSMLYGETEVAA